MLRLPALRPLLFVGLLIVIAACVMLPAHITNARRGSTTTEGRNDHELTASSAKYSADGAFSSAPKEYFYHNGKSLLIAYTPPPPAFNGYNYQRTLTIDHSQVPNTDQSNFPVLISQRWLTMATFRIPAAMM